MGYFRWKPYVPVAKRRQNAAAHAKKLAKNGEPVAPVVIEGRTIARTFWGKSWCENLERYSDYENRLPRGRTYVRNGSVVDLKAGRGEITALVSGSDIYTVKVTVAPVSPKVWKELCVDCAGSINSLVELLQGRFSDAVMERVCMPAKGLFPSPKDIKFACSCPDWAGMCKHVAAALYGVGARLDKSPEHLFTLRGVDHNELVAKAGKGLPLSKKPASAKRIMTGGDLSSVFGLEMAEGGEGAADSPAPAKPKSRTKTKSAPPSEKKGTKPPAAKAASGGKTATKSASARTARASPGGGTAKRGAQKSETAKGQETATKTASRSKTVRKAAQGRRTAPTAGTASKTPAKSTAVKAATAAKASTKAPAGTARRGGKLRSK
jgi:uncharacterized Zn finger protein